MGVGGAGGGRREDSATLQCRHWPACGMRRYLPERMTANGSFRILVYSWLYAPLHRHGVVDTPRSFSLEGTLGLTSGRD